MRTTPAQRLAISEAAWAAATRLGTFSYHALAADRRISLPHATRLVRGWIDAGAVVPVGPGPARRLLFRVAPGWKGIPGLTRADGSPLRVVTPLDNMWRSMRSLRSFTALDVAAHADTGTVEVSPEAAQNYCTVLLRSGHLTVMRKAATGRDAIYRLVRNTGPLPPRECRVRAVWDDNIGGFAHIAGVEA